jgi:hypothetical protein
LTSIAAWVELWSKVRLSVRAGRVVAPTNKSSKEISKETESRPLTISKISPWSDHQVPVPSPQWQTLLVDEASLKLLKSLVDRANLLQEVVEVESRPRESSSSAAAKHLAQTLLDVANLSVELGGGLLN